MVLGIAAVVLMVIGLIVAWGSDIDSQVEASVDSLHENSMPRPKQAA